MPEPLNLPDNPEYCPTCNTKFLGAFCYSCGEKKPSRKDFTISKYATQAVDMFTHFDGKFFTSIKYLLFYPGKLTAENLQGRKVKLMKPVQLFLVVSLVYFFLMKTGDVFITYLKYSDTQGLLHKAAERKADEKSISFEEYKQHYDDALPGISKTFVFIMVPMIALGVWLFYFRRIRAFVPHLIFATHFFIFFLVFTLVYFEVLSIWINSEMLSRGGRLLGLGIGTLIISVYLFFGLRNVYRQGMWITAGKTALLMIWFFLVLGIYRDGVSWIYLFLS